MKKNKILVLVALVVGVIALAIGFAAYGAQLNITDTKAIVDSSSSFNIHFPTSGTITPVASTGATGSVATTTGTSITGFNATFTNVNQTVTYSTTITNDAGYIAYLTDVIYTGNKVCQPGLDNPPSLDLSNYCDGFKMKVTVKNGSTKYVDNITDTVNGLSGKSVASKGVLDVEVVLTYDKPTLPDGSFSVTYPTLSFVFSTVDNESIPPEEDPPEPSSTAYYAFGEPTTSSTTDYTTLSQNVFIKLENEELSACLNVEGKAYCVPTNYWVPGDNEGHATKAKLEMIFPSVEGWECSGDSDGANCSLGDFYCRAYSNGNVECFGADTRCNVDYEGSADCSW